MSWVRKIFDLGRSKYNASFTVVNPPWDAELCADCGYVRYSGGEHKAGCRGARSSYTWEKPLRFPNHPIYPWDTSRYIKEPKMKNIEFTLPHKRLPSSAAMLSTKELALIKALEEALSMPSQVIADRAKKDRYGSTTVICRPDQFAAFIMLRQKYGAENWIAELNAAWQGEKTSLGDTWDVSKAAHKNERITAEGRCDGATSHDEMHAYVADIIKNGRLDAPTAKAVIRSFGVERIINLSWAQLSDYKRAIDKASECFVVRAALEGIEVAAFHPPLSDVAEAAWEKHGISSVLRDRVLDEAADALDERATRMLNKARFAPGRFRDIVAKSADRENKTANFLRSMKGGKTAKEARSETIREYLRGLLGKFYVKLDGLSKVAYFINSEKRDVVKIDGEHTYLHLNDARLDWSDAKRIPFSRVEE